MIHLSKLWWGLIIFIVFIGGVIVWFVWDGYAIRLWWQRTTNPSLEYRDYTNIDDGVRITDQEMTESAKSVKLVEQIPEVAEWLKQFSGPKGTSTKTYARGFVQTESRLGDVYSVHVYEEPGLYEHFPIKTIGWYEVNRKTWEVKGVK